MFVLAADRDNHRRDVHTHPRYSCDTPQCKVFKINSDELHQHKRDTHWDVFRFRCCVRPCYHVFKVSTGRTGASARSVRGDLLRDIGSSTTA